MIGAGNVAGAACASTHASGGFNHCADHLRMLAHAKVIVRAPDHDRARAIRGMPYCVWEMPGNALEIGKHAVALFLVQLRKRARKEITIFHRANSASGWSSTVLTIPIRRAAGDRGCHRLLAWRWMTEMPFALIAVCAGTMTSLIAALCAPPCRRSA